jgi:hypothetical protein
MQVDVTKVTEGNVTGNDNLIPRPTHLYVGAGWDTKPFEADWAVGATIHCVDGQPHSEFGTETCFEDGKNRYSRPHFVERVLDSYKDAGFVCSDEDRDELSATGLLSEDRTGSRRVVRFDHTSRDIVVWFHFNSGLPDHVAEIALMVGTYQGMLCSGHWANKTAMSEAFNILDHSLTFRGYAYTNFEVDNDVISMEDIEKSVVGRLFYDRSYRRKFKHFVFHDVCGEEHWFDKWEEFLVWIEYNSDLAYGGGEDESEEDDHEKAKREAKPLPQSRNPVERVRRRKKGLFEPLMAKVKQRKKMQRKSTNVMGFDMTEEK